jgi:hypothetical protein
VRTSFESILD